MFMSCTIISAIMIVILSNVLKSNPASGVGGRHLRDVLALQDEEVIDKVER